jgi:hypothetical protein
MGQKEAEEMIDELFPFLDSDSCGSADEHDLFEAGPPVPPPVLPPVPLFGLDVPPAHHVEEASQASSNRDPATCTVVYPPYGVIAYYAKGRRFQATCFEACAHHNRCRLTRYSSPSCTMPAKGRPLGLMMAWLRFSSGAGTRQEHIHQFYLMLLTFERRSHGRAVLQTLTNGVQMCTHERHCREGEGQEPVGVP